VTSPLTSADGHLDESIQLLNINGKNNAAASPLCSTTQEQEAASMTASDHLPSDARHLNDFVSDEKADPSTSC